MKSISKSAAAIAAAALSPLLLQGCNVGNDPTFRLGVPFFAQAIDSFDCGPATVQMWAGYDHGVNNVPSQQTIANFMGGTGSGTSPQNIADAVEHYTDTWDALWDFVADWESDEFMSRQITSVDNYRPVIAIVDSGFHAVIVVGGEWHDVSNGYVWDYVQYHDPLVAGDLRQDSTSWIAESCPSGSTCQQVVDQSAIGAWGSNLGSYGSSVYDSTGCGSGGCNQEYKD